MTTHDLRESVDRRFAASMQVPAHFFEAHGELIARACLAMARRFQRGGRLLVFGEGAEATDAQHVAVEFVHPVIVGKRALPAIALPNDYASITGMDREPRTDGRRNGFARAIDVLGREQDIAMGIGRGDGAGVTDALVRAAALGMLTLAVVGGRGAESGGLSSVPDGRHPDFLFRVGSADPLVVQETQETLCHVLWELVHVFFEQGLAAGEGDAVH